MKKMRKQFLKTALFLGLLLAGPSFTNLHAECNDALPGWHVLAPDFSDSLSYLTSGVIFEWDYLMVHDKNGSFTGSLGIVVADPGKKLVGLMPSGGNAAISGKFASGDIVVDYLPFGTENYTASSDTRQFSAENDAGLFARIDPIAASGNSPQGLHWTGRTEKYEYDLMIEPDWIDRCDDYLDEFPVIKGDDASATSILGLFDFIPDQSWSIDMHWMRTKVSGWVFNRLTEERAVIDGWGYRENAWGPWGFVFSGWDFGIASDNASGIQWSWQSYHHSDKLDYLDVSFYDNDELKVIRFDTIGNELGWYHPDWKYDNETWQCTPLSTIIVGMNEEYIVEAEMEINNNQAPMLSDYTPITSTYFIQTLYPEYTVTIRRASAPHEIIASFKDVQGGGEFSGNRNLLNDIFGPKSSEQCLKWGEKYSQEFPSEYNSTYSNNN